MNISLHVKGDTYKQCCLCHDLKETYFYYWCKCGWTENITCIECVEDKNLPTKVFRVENCFCEKEIQHTDLRDLLKDIYEDLKKFYEDFI